MTEQRSSTHSDSKGPVITHAFAVDRGHYGCILKIFIEAEDQDGDMDRIAVVVDQTGHGYYPTDWIILKPQYRGHFTGYLQWNTFSSKASYISEWTRMKVKVSIYDKPGNESNEVVFPFTFQSDVKDEDESQLPPPFDRREIPRLGYIRVDLYYEDR